MPELAGRPETLISIKQRKPQLLLVRKNWGFINLLAFGITKSPRPEQH